ncbi:MAG TPA: adenosylcobinamide-GDP ribazoletransferase [Alphaproteobacteria bacterium]
MTDSHTDPSHAAEHTSLRAELWRETKIAAAFLTRLPVPLTERESATPLAEAPRGFTLVGIALGALAAIVYILAAELGLPAAVAALLAIGALILVTGAMHEDGLADTADGFGGGRDRETTLAIMRDSRIGSYGVLALVIVIGLRVLCVAELHESFTAALALIAAAAGSRAVLPVALLYVPPARDDGLGHAAGRPNRRMTIDAAAIGGAAVLIGLGPVGGLLAAAGVAGTTYAIGRLALRRIGGQTGDVLGAIQQAAEAVILLAAVATQP